MYNMTSSISVSHVSSMGTRYFVTAEDRMGGMNTIRIDGFTRDLVLEYRSRYCIHPAPSFFRNQHHPTRCLTSEEIAKLCPSVMEGVGVDMHVFRPHGNIATFLLSLGVDKKLVQNPGQCSFGRLTFGRSSELCIDRYYSRLHEYIPWDYCLWSLGSRMVIPR